MVDVMTDRHTILKMIHMILDGCKDLEEAKKKVDEFMSDEKTSQEN